MNRKLIALLALTAVFGCNKSTTEETAATPSPLMELSALSQTSLSGLSAPVQVAFTDYGIPHVYAENRTDLHRVQGYLLARDRFFMLDLTRRMGTGTVSGLMGDAGLGADMENRGIGQTYIVDKMTASLPDEQAQYIDAFADGINQYIEQVGLGNEQPPSELEFAASLLGYSAPVDAMKPWDRRDVVALMGAILYRLGFSSSDISRTSDLDRLESLFSGEALESLRKSGAYDDIWAQVAPPFLETSTPDWNQDAYGPDHPPARPNAPAQRPSMPAPLFGRLNRHLDAFRDRTGRDRELGWGSNAWAVAGTHTADGRAIIAADGHLELVVPALLYQMGLDTAHLGGGSMHSFGNILAGMPFPVNGTNGSIAWSTTQHGGDITDWYAEELQLDSEGQPTSSLFNGEWKPLVGFEEVFEVAEIPAPIDSRGRTLHTTRWTTFDGRWIASVEGIVATEQTVPEAGQTLINVLGDWIIPGDTDGDGVISAMSFDFGGLDDGNLMVTINQWSGAKTVEDFQAIAAGSIALSQNTVVADTTGSIYFSGYQTTPCRTYLPRDSDGIFLDGANPQMLLDGTKYGGFTLPFDDAFHPIEGSSDPYSCVIPQLEYPWTIDPNQGFIVSANNDPGNYTLDGDLFGQGWYIGGPWEGGFRADRITRLIKQQIGENGVTIESMARIQADDESTLGRQTSPALLQAIETARGLDALDSLTEAQTRVLDLYQANLTEFDAVYSRIKAWNEGGWRAQSGVKTFYNTIDPGELDDAVATMIHNTWQDYLVQLTIGDEGIPGRVWRPNGSTGQMRLLFSMLRSRGDNVDGLSSWNPDTLESAFFDLRGTDLIETSDEIILMALERALVFLASAPTEPDRGGFGTDDMSEWIWGMRHQVRFTSLVAREVNDPSFSAMLNQFNIDTSVIPLDAGMLPTDPRKALTWFPRKGDNLGVDAANHGFHQSNFKHGSGSVNRMVYALGPNGVEGQEVIPGGQSGLISSEHFSDQIPLWLENKAIPVYLDVADVVAHSSGRETFSPE